MTPKPTLSLEDLKNKALAAAPGPWATSARRNSYLPYRWHPYIEIPAMSSHDAKQTAEYLVVVSPDVVLNLIERLSGMTSVMSRIWQDTEQPVIELMAQNALEKWGTK